jgi:rod shape-determining protein MreC
VAVTRRPSRARYLLLILVLLAVTLVTLNQRGGSGTLGSVRAKVQDVTSPIQRVVHSALQPIGNFLSGAADYGSLKKENQRLLQQLANQQNQGLAASAAEAQANSVLAQQHLPFVGNIPTVTAEVIDNDPSNFEDTVTINKGTRSGIAVGQPVVVTDGLAGTIADASPNTAVVRLLTDPSFVVGIRLGNLVGSAEGEGLGEPMQVTFDQPVTPGGISSTSTTTPTTASPTTTTPTTAAGSSAKGTKPKSPGSKAPSAGTGFTLTKGTAVYTSGLDLETFPRGIPVARVASFSDPPSAPEPTVTLTPLVNLSQLDFVQVELWAPQTGGS